MRFVQLEDRFRVANKENANTFGKHGVNVRLKERGRWPKMRYHQKYQLLGGTQILQIVDLLQRSERETSTQ